MRALPLPPAPQPRGLAPARCCPPRPQPRPRFRPRPGGPWPRGSLSLPASSARPRRVPQVLSGMGRGIQGDMSRSEMPFGVAARREDFRGVRNREDSAVGECVYVHRPSESIRGSPSWRGRVLGSLWRGQSSESPNSIDTVGELSGWRQ